MAVAAPRTKKNDSATETARVMRVFDMLAEEIRRRVNKPLLWDEGVRILGVADRIAARTEDPA